MQETYCKMLSLFFLLLRSSLPKQHLPQPFSSVGVRLHDNCWCKCQMLVVFEQERSGSQKHTVNPKMKRGKQNLCWSLKSKRVHSFLLLEKLLHYCFYSPLINSAEVVLHFLGNPSHFEKSLGLMREPLIGLFLELVLNLNQFYPYKAKPMFHNVRRLPKENDWATSLHLIQFAWFLFGKQCDLSAPKSLNLLYFSYCDVRQTNIYNILLFLQVELLLLSFLKYWEWYRLR